MKIPNQAVKSALHSLEKRLNSGSAIFVARSLGRYKKQCVKCSIQTFHNKHEDEDGNEYYFCENCDTHN